MPSDRWASVAVWPDGRAGSWSTHRSRLGAWRACRRKAAAFGGYTEFAGVRWRIRRADAV